ncbi:purple acid phosphatase family protein [Paenibacillus sp. IITD108]|uniref:purple acid phosphatase family protein n=1 Tax=Paenibacillus sp. IITD108 TaxID=3116649 RepID=UPI002F4126E0
MSGIKRWIAIAGAVFLTIAVLAGVFIYHALQQQRPHSIVTTFRGDPHTSRAFTWQSPAGDSKAVLQLVKADGKKSDWSDERVITVDAQTTVMSDDNGASYRIHKAEASGLEAGTMYQYRVGDGTKWGWSKTSSFRTEAEHTEAFTFINVTDSQGETEQHFNIWKDTLDQAFKQFPQAEFIVHNGDFVEYPEDTDAWKLLLNKASEWITSVPLMPVTGNHDEVKGDAKEFSARFFVPDNGASKSNPGTTYSFQYGSALFIMLNTESNKKEQTRWLEEQLAANTKEWIIVSMHKGPYGGKPNENIQDWVELFDQYKVDLVLQGHNHEYARSFPMRDGKVVANSGEIVSGREGTVYVVTNAAGAKLNKKKEDQFYHQVHFQNGEAMFAGITIEGDSLVYSAHNRSGRLLDRFGLRH